MNEKKCIVLDLDNTLWGGIVGEDGIDGIQLSLSPPGSSFIAFQQVLLDLFNRGVLLAINSRNNVEDALAVIRSHPNMILKEQHFAASRINWGSKADNIRELAQELNIGLDAMVFFDDDPLHRASVRSALPDVEVPEFPNNPSEYAQFVLGLPYFASTAVTDEDKMRGNLYVTERLRREAEKSFSNHEEFLKDIGLTLKVYVDDSSSVARLSQLTEKTNQFNVHKQPLTIEEIARLIDRHDRTVFHGWATDRFGDHGITVFAVAEHQGEVWHLSSLLISCRVIGRGIEDAFLSAIAQVAKEQGIKHISIAFIPTEKNAPAKEFVQARFGDAPLSVGAALHPPAWITTTVHHGKVQ